MANAKSYSALRLANLDENRRMLQELGVRMPSAGERVMLNKPKAPPKRPKQRVPEKISEPNTDEGDKEGTEDNGGSFHHKLGRTFRVRLKTKYYQEEDDNICEAPRPRLPRIRPENAYGSIPGVEVGREWDTRMACSYDLIHRPTVAGIHAGPDGAYSVALSGGYEDDVDFGESFTYTGEGGRDLKGTACNPKNLRTAPQSKDQSLERGNLALSRNVETQKPVRVVRGYKLDSPYAPEFGYRYDGLYQVKKYWAARGKSGYKVWKFAFVRCDSEPAPWKKVPSGTLIESPTSPTTPSSIPQTGMEACEAPVLDGEDSEDNSLMEEAKKEAKQPEEQRGYKKKVSFNSENFVRFFETDESDAEEKSGRRVTRGSSKTEVTESGESEEEEIQPPAFRERSKRAVKPTAKVLENISLKYDKEASKSQNEVAVTKKSDTAEEKKGCTKENVFKSFENDKPPSKTSASKSPSPSPEYPLEDVSKSPGENPKKLMKPPARVEPGKRSVSPEYPPVEDIPKKSQKTVSVEKPKKWSRSPEYPPEDLERRSNSSSIGKIRKQSVSPKYLVEESKKSSKARSLVNWAKKSPQKSPKTRNSPTENKRTKRSPSPEYPPEDVEKRSKSSSNEKHKELKSPKHPTFNASKKQSKSPRSSQESMGKTKAKKGRNSPTERGKKSPKSPKKEGVSKISTPQKVSNKRSPQSKKSPDTVVQSESQKDKAPRSVKSPKMISPKKSPSRTSRSLSKTSPKTKTELKKTVTKVSKSPSSPDTFSEEESPTKTARSKKKARKLYSGDPMEMVKCVEDGNYDENLSDRELSPKSNGDVPTSSESVSIEREKRKRGRPTKTSLPVEPVIKKRKKEVEVTETLTPSETETSNSNSSSPTSPASAASSSCDTPLSDAKESIEKADCTSDDDDFPTDDEILSMMRFSVSSCSNDGRKITVRMVNGKWVEEEEEEQSSHVDTPKKKNACSVKATVKSECYPHEQLR